MFTPETKSAIIQVANYIGCDVDTTDPEEMVELCIDASRLITCANSQAAEDEVMALIKEHGYDAVLKAGAKFVPCN